MKILVFYYLKHNLNYNVNNLRESAINRAEPNGPKI